jgi:hypothetical protein
MKAPAGIPTLVITGTIGAGKTALATDIGEVMQFRGHPTAVIDLDWLGWLCAPSAHGSPLEELILTNLSAVWPNFVTAGAERFVLVRVIQDRGHLDALRQSVPDAEITVVRVKTTPAAIAERLRLRDTGEILEWHLVESAEMEKTVAAAAVEDLLVVNDDRAIREVTLEVIDRVGW